MSGGEALLFWLLAPATVLGALGLLFARKAVHAAMSMAAVMVALGIIFIAQQAEFVGIIQIFVYSGAVMMLFLFVVMLIGVDAADSMIETLRGQRFWAWLLGLVFLGLAWMVVARVTFTDDEGQLAAAVEQDGTVTALAREIFSTQVFSFELLGALLVIAVMGAMVLAHQERLVPKKTQKEASEEKIRSNTWVAGKPNPGVYARHNAADTPALLPDGTPVEDSVPRVLVARDQINREAALEGRAGQALAETEAAYEEIEASEDELEPPAGEREEGSTR